MFYNLAKNFLAISPLHRCVLPQRLRRARFSSHGGRLWRLGRLGRPTRVLQLEAKWSSWTCIRSRVVNLLHLGEVANYYLEHFGALFWYNASIGYIGNEVGVWYCMVVLPFLSNFCHQISLQRPLVLCSWRASVVVAGVIQGLPFWCRGLWWRVCLWWWQHLLQWRYGSAAEGSSSWERLDLLPDHWHSSMSPVKRWCHEGYPRIEGWISGFRLWPDGSELQSLFRSLVPEALQLRLCKNDQKCLSFFFFFKLCFFLLSFLQWGEATEVVSVSIRKTDLT